MPLRKTAHEAHRAYATTPRSREHNIVMADLAIELQKIYDSEINVRIGWLWDAGINIRLGDEMNGFEAEKNVRSTDEILP